MGKIMLPALEGLPHTSHILMRGSRLVPVHAMLGSCGFSYETQSRYDFDGLTRGEREFALFQYTLSGEGAVDFEGVTHQIRPGQLLLLYIPHQHRYFLPPDSSHWEFIYIVLNGREVVRLWRWLVGRLGPCPNIAATSPAIQLAAEIVKAAHENTEFDPFELSAMAYQLTMRVCKEAAIPADAGRPAEFARRAMTYCQAHFNEPIGVTEMAAAARYSPAHFSRMFRHYVGMTPRQYLEDVRVRQATGMLREPDCSIAEVSRACGFADANYFAKVFRRVMGQSPREFRRSRLF